MRGNTQKVAEIARDTEINRNTLHRLYNETATRVDLEVIEKLCRHLDIEVGELFELVKDQEGPEH